MEIKEEETTEKAMEDKGDEGNGRRSKRQQRQ